MMNTRTALAPAFVGRGEELADLRAAIAAARHGRGSVVLVAGEPGIGKTRLAEEATASVAQSAMRVLWGRSWDGGLTPAFWPWLQIVQSCLADVEGDLVWPERSDGRPFDAL